MRAFMLAACFFHRESLLLEIAHAYFQESHISTLKIEFLTKFGISLKFHKIINLHKYSLLKFLINVLNRIFNLITYSDMILILNYSQLNRLIGF